MEDTQILTQLNPTRSVISVIGNLCNNPELLRHPDKRIKTDDFFSEIHQMIFDVINNLTYAELDRQEITSIDIDSYLSEYPEAYGLWNRQNGVKYIDQAKKFASQDNYSVDYARLKKFSLLRAVHEQGMDVKCFYDYESDDADIIDKNMKKIDSITLNEMIDHYSKIIISLRDDFAETNNANTYKAGDGILEMLNQVNDNPLYGHPFRNRFYNSIIRGMQPKKMLLRSADSGTGKTRQNLNDLIYLSMTHIWSVEKEDFVSIGKAYPSLYIGTEEEKEEVDRLILAIVSGVDQDVIEEGGFSPQVAERLMKAVEIIQDGELYIHRDDDFSITDIEMSIEKFIIDHGVKYVGFDYIQLTPKISRSALEMFGQQLREDLIISTFAGKLKDIAQKYDIFMLSSTQLNRNSVDKTQRNANCLAGGKATQNKIDYGIQLYRVDSDDLKQLEPILNNGFEEPNYSHWFYKNRGNKYPDCIVWSKMNLGNMHERELFVTDRNYNLINVPLTEIDFETKTVTKSDDGVKHSGDFVTPQF